MHRLAILFLLLRLGAAAEEFTRGPGTYPGRPSESSAPRLEPGPPERRNLALRRPVYQSSAYDYNLTAQLLTDGITERELPRWISVATSEKGTLKKPQRERLFDGNWVTDLALTGSALLPPDQEPPWVRLDVHGPLPEVDAMELTGMVKGVGTNPENWACALLGSEDGEAWQRLGMASGMTHAGGEFTARIPLATASHCRAYRLELLDARAHHWSLQEWTFSHHGKPVPMGGPHAFFSAWKSAGQQQEWVYVDLGTPSRFDRVVLAWLRRPKAGALQVSLDAKTWKTVIPLPVEGDTDDLHLPMQKARFVRVLMERPATHEGYVLSELEVWGHGGLMPVAKPMPAPDAAGNLDISGGAWRVARETETSATGETLSRPDFQDQTWLPATVPGTVLASYVNAGALPEPNFGDHQLLVSDSFFHADFWYRNTFSAPPCPPGRRQWLCFDGINWKAEVFFNGQPLGRIEGAFSRRRFDVTDLLHPGQPNALAVRIEKNAHPGSVKEKTYEEPGENGGVLGMDSPTFHAAIGWDWIPTIRGRNTGIWDRVRLVTSGAVILEDPAVSTHLSLPDTSTADLQISVTLRPHGTETVKGRLVGRFGDQTFEQAVTLEKGQATTLRLDPTTHPVLRLQQPRLWWPNGYGEPNLYEVVLSFIPEGQTQPSDVRRFQAGVRQFNSTPEGQPLRLWINGRRFIPKGGNWGFSESMLRYRERDFEAALRYHRDMHFNMVRNWLGMVGQDAFFEACDRNGIVVWQDFWLANPWDGENPGSQTLFLGNAAELVSRLRTHPSIGLYCGRNEGYPPRDIEDGLRALLAREHPGIPFVPSSADGAVGGYGPYQAQPVDTYATRHAMTKLHTEMGLPNIPTLDGLRAMMPEEDLWPQGRMWGLHDFCMTGAQGGASFLEMLRKAYGQAGSAQDWVDQAQFLNYDGYRAMFEAQNEHRMGLLIWMSHPAWPSLVWQTYDYFLEPTAAYFGAKKACEPLHIQWNPGTTQVQVINTSAGNQVGLTAKARLYRLDGSLAWEKETPLDSPEDSTLPLFSVQRPMNLGPAYLLRLQLVRGEQTLSTNDYLRGIEETDTQAFRTLPAAEVVLTQRMERQGERWLLHATLHNASAVPALQLCLSVRRQRSGDLILPALFSDNYLTLLPGEKRDLLIEVRQEDTRGEEPSLRLRGANLLLTK